MAVEKITLSETNFPPILAFIEKVDEKEFIYKGIILEGDKVTHTVKIDNGKRYPYERRQFFSHEGQQYAATPLEVVKNSGPSAESEAPTLHWVIEAFFKSTDSAIDFDRDYKGKMENSLEPIIKAELGHLRTPQNLTQAHDVDKVAKNLTALMLQHYMVSHDADLWLSATQSDPAFTRIAEGTGFSPDDVKGLLPKVLHKINALYLEKAEALPVPVIDNSPEGVLSHIVPFMPPSLGEALRLHHQSTMSRMSPPPPGDSARSV